MQQVAAQVAVAVDNTLNFQKAEKYQQQLVRERDRLQVLLEITNTWCRNWISAICFPASPLACAALSLTNMPASPCACPEPISSGFTRWFLTGRVPCSRKAPQPP